MTESPPDLDWHAIFDVASKEEPVFEGVAESDLFETLIQVVSHIEPLHAEHGDAVCGRALSALRLEIWPDIPRYLTGANRSALLDGLVACHLIPNAKAIPKGAWDVWEDVHGELGENEVEALAMLLAAGEEPRFFEALATSLDILDHLSTSSKSHQVEPILEEWSAKHPEDKYAKYWMKRRKGG